MLREACYRVIGEASDNEGVISQFVFADWYNNELRALLQAPDNQVRGNGDQLMPVHRKRRTLGKLFLLFLL